MNIIFIGPPGSGKGTQAKLLSARLKLPRIDIGELMRQEYFKKTKIGLKAQEYMTRGVNVPAEIVFKVLKKKLEKAKKGFVLDNYPRSLEQLEIFRDYIKKENKKIDKVFHVRASFGTCLERVKKRVFEAQEKREDETEEIFKTRYNEGYKKDIDFILQIFKKQKVLVEINGDQPPEAVFQEILSCLSS